MHSEVKTAKRNSFWYGFGISSLVFTLLVSFLLATSTIQVNPVLWGRTQPQTKGSHKICDRMGVYLYSGLNLTGSRQFYAVGDHDIPDDFLSKSLLMCPNGAYNVETRDHTNRPGTWDCSRDLPLDWRNEGGKPVALKIEKRSDLKTDCPKYP